MNIEVIKPVSNKYVLELDDQELTIITAALGEMTANKIKDALDDFDYKGAKIPEDQKELSALIGDTWRKLKGALAL